VQRHTRAQVWAARQRAIRKWQRFRRLFVTGGANYGYRLSAEDRPFQQVHVRSGTICDDSWWFQEGRFNKLKHDCRMCRADHAAGKWRVLRGAEERRLDRYEEAAW
jgi:hypothetical protein